MDAVEEDSSVNKGSFEYHLLEKIDQNIAIYQIRETEQYIIIHQGTEYTFALEEDARRFAQQLVKFRENYKYGTMEHPKPQAKPGVARVPIPPKRGPKKDLL